MKWFALLAAAAGHLCFGQQVCPWLNTPTASGVLESSAVATAGKGSCEFKARTGQVQIRVNATAHAERDFATLSKRCKAGRETLKAIGNEAFACLHGNRYWVTGRVRGQIFTVTIAMKGVKREVLREKARLVAQQVSGALF